MPKYIRIIIFSILFVFWNPSLLQANYTFSDSFDTATFTSWITIPDHIQPDVVENSERTFARFHQGGSNSYAYLASKDDNNKVVSVRFDFFYPSGPSTQGAGFMLTNKVPMMSQNPPNDNGDYSVGIWPIAGNFYLLSPLCDNTTLCNLPIYSRALFKIDSQTWNTIQIDYLVDHVRVKLNESSLLLPYDSFDLPNGFFLGNPVLATNPQSWMDFYIDNLSIEYGDPTIISPTFPYLSQKDVAWAGTEYDSSHLWAPLLEQGIDRWGCALTSAAMILQQYGVKTITDNVDVNPDNLNTWLKAQVDGYIGPGLVNWIAITRYVRESYIAGHADTKLEFERSYLPTAPILPVILGLPGHFVVAYDDDPLTWIINDPANLSNTSLNKSSTVNSVNRFVPSLTDLSYMMFVIDNAVTANLTNERGEPVPITWSEEYLTDDVGGTPNLHKKVGMVQKPLNGHYKLVMSQPDSTTNELRVYLYDDIAQVIPKIYPLTGTKSTIDIVYSKEPEGARSSALLDLLPPPVPTLLSPSNLAHVNTNGLILDWSDVSDPSEPVTYNYKSTWSGGVYGPVTTGTNSYIAASGTPDQTYVWQVQACDSVVNCSEWSTRTLIVDSTSPTADIVFPSPGPSSNYFEVAFSELVNPVEATSGASYFLSNWPGAGGNGDLVGDANITYNPESKTARIIFTNLGWYISPEQLWGVQNIHDLAGNLLSSNPTTEYSTQVTNPALTSAPITTPNPTNQISQTWSWLTATDVGSGVKGYSTRNYDVVAQQYLSDWLWIGQVLGTTTSLTEGSWQLSLRATDNAGNNSAILSSSNLIVDTTSPSIPTNLHFDNPSVSCGGYTRDRLVTIDWDDSIDNSRVTGYEYNVDYPLGAERGSWTTFFTSSSYRGSLNEGIHYIKLRSKDTAGNYSAWSNSCSITYDSVTPIVTLDVWGRRLQGTSTDSLSGIDRIEIKLTKPNGSQDTVTPAGKEYWEYTIADAQTGDYKVVIVVYDNAGNVSDELIKEYNIGVASSPPPTNLQSVVLGASTESLPKEEVSEPHSTYQTSTIFAPENEIEELIPNPNNDSDQVLGESTKTEKSKIKYLLLTIPILLTLIVVVSKLLKSKGHRA